MRIPANVANASTKMKRRTEELEHSLERMPTMEELVEVMGREAERLVQFNTRSLSIDQSIFNDDTTSLRDMLKTDDSLPETKITKQSLDEEIKHLQHVKRDALLRVFLC